MFYLRYASDARDLDMYAYYEDIACAFKIVEKNALVWTVGWVASRQNKEN